ncbi:MAG: kynureninase [Bdellovibrionota bacterium]
MGTLEGARKLDQQDLLREFRNEFNFPKTANGENQLYFAGHSLGLMPKNAKEYVNEELEAWAELGVEGHFHAKHPWLPYHENITGSFARLVGAKETEVVAMNTLTVNLHLLMVSFYRPTAKKFKILIENNTFPSDKYAVDSQARFHGYNPKEAVVELKPRPGEMIVREEDLFEQIDKLGDSLALVLLGNCNYLSGQCFPFEKITEKAHSHGATVGFNLAHGAGNLHLKLHDWNVDFAVWCSYKYVNSGPGGLAGAFIHENHLNKKTIPRFEGWWGTKKESRFKMGPDFEALPTAEAWQLSNPPIFQLASLRASMEIFDKATMEKLSQKRNHLTSFMEWNLQTKLGSNIEVVTPPERGAMLCVRVKKDPKHLLEVLKSRSVILDFRYPDILRMTPAPLYNSFEDVHRLIEIMKEALEEKPTRAT